MSQYTVLLMPPPSLPSLPSLPAIYDGDRAAAGVRDRRVRSRPHLRHTGATILVGGGTGLVTAAWMVHWVAAAAGGLAPVHGMFWLSRNRLVGS